MREPTKTEIYERVEERLAHIRRSKDREFVAAVAGYARGYIGAMLAICTLEELDR